MLLQVQCNYNKPLTYKWFQNGIPIENSNTMTNFSFENGIYTLSIDKIDFERNNGVYSFAVKNYKDDSFLCCSSYVFISGNWNFL